MSSLNRRSQPKKLVIKNLSVKHVPQADFEQQAWGKLQAAVRAIHHCTKVPESLEELYRTCENMCHYKLAAKLYDNLLAECKLHVQEILARLREHGVDTPSFLELVNREWTDYCRQVIMVRSIFLYLDRTYVLQTPTVDSLWNMCMNLFRYNIIQCEDIGEQVLKQLLALVEQERKHEQVQRMLIKSLIDMYRDLSIYSTAFETPFLQGVYVYYEAEGRRVAQEMSAADFSLHCERRLKEEEDRADHYMDAGRTRKRLVSFVEEGLVRGPMETVLEKGFDELAEQIDILAMRRFYTLCKRIDRLDLLRSAFATYIMRVVKDIVSDAEHDTQMIDRLLELKERLDQMRREAFENAESFGHAIMDSIEKSINTRAHRPAELIAHHANRLLLGGNKLARDDRLEEMLDRLLILFRLISDKDVFEAFYKRDLAKRLLNKRSASDDMEKLMLVKLRDICGANFTYKFECMMKDMNLSQEIVSKFRASKLARVTEGVDVNVNVLTYGIWPPYPTLEVNLPPKFAEFQAAYKEFYVETYANRTLTWQHTLGHCTLRAQFDTCTKQLQVTLLQAIVLMLFNDIPDDKSLSYHDIANTTGIETKELKCVLLSLASRKDRILKRISQSQHIEETDAFSVNTSFTSPKHRVKIEVIRPKEKKEEDRETKEQVFQDRQFQVDAAIVRIMKARRKISHLDLGAQLYELLKFQVQPPDLKKRIESLIERDFIERDPDNNSVYQYIA